MTPKSLLRLDRAASWLADLTTGHFEAVLDDPDRRPTRRIEQVISRLVFCSGKIYYDLSAADVPSHVARSRTEQLYPWPHEGVAWALDLYPGVDEVVWAQEEPKNMGAWTFVAPRLRVAAGNAIPVTYIGRPERASPAEGYQASHQREQSRLVAEVLEGRPRPGTRALERHRRRRTRDGADAGRAAGAGANAHAGAELMRRPGARARGPRVARTDRIVHDGGSCSRAEGRRARTTDVPVAPAYAHGLQRRWPSRWRGWATPCAC